ncbi:hypothetical protein CsatA_004293 [Cannabis sativa]
MDTPLEAAKVDSDVAEPNSDNANDESTAATETGEPESTKNLGHRKKVVETDATPSNPPPAASTVPPAAAKKGDSSLPQRESQPEKPKRFPKQVARKSVRPYKTWTSSSSSSKESPPPAAVSPPAASVPASTPTGPSTRTRAQHQASVEKELRSSRSRDKPAPPAKKLKTSPPSVSSSSEEEEPMEVSSDKFVSLHYEKEIPEDIGVSSDSEETELEPEPPLTKSASTPALSSSAAKASAAAKGKQPMMESSPGNIPTSLSYCPRFYYRDNERDWNLYATRKFESERNYDLHAHRVYGIVKFIQCHQWENTLSCFKGYIANIVKDFNANLSDDFLDENSRLYRKVYVRGHWFSFSEKDISQALQLPENVPNAIMSMDRQLMLTELTGARAELKSGESLRITHLTFAHASLMRFALSNCVPNSNKTVVSQDVASFLYRITSGASIDLASHILNQIKNVAQSHETLEPSLTGTPFQPSEYFDGVFQKRPKAGAAAAASLNSASAEIQEVKNEVQLVNNRLGAMEEVQQEMSKQLSTLVKLYRD